MFKTEEQIRFLQIEDFEYLSISKQPQICKKKCIYIIYLFICASIIIACCFVWVKYFQQ